VSLGAEADPAAIVAPADKVLALRVFIAAPAASLAGESTDIVLLLTGADGRIEQAPTVFRGP